MSTYGSPNVLTRPIVHLLVALIASATIVAVQPRTTHAGCGDYLLSRPEVGRARLSTSVAGAIQDLSYASGARPAPPADRGPARCNGIDCSPGAIPPLELIRVTTLERHDVMLSSAVNPPRDRVAAVCPPESSARSACQLARIFRPPRQNAFAL